MPHGLGVAAYKLPEEIEIFDEFPFTPTGKIQRHTLARQVLARLARRPSCGPSKATAARCWPGPAVNAPT